MFDIPARIMPEWIDTLHLPLSGIGLFCMNSLVETFARHSGFRCFASGVFGKSLGGRARASPSPV